MVSGKQQDHQQFLPCSSPQNDSWVSSSFAATLTYDTLRFGEFEDFPETTEPVWILGKEYNALTGRTVKYDVYVREISISVRKIVKCK